MSSDLDQAVPENVLEAVPPVRAADSDDPVALKNKLDLVTADRQRERDEKQALKKQIEDKEREFQEAAKARLVQTEDYKTLYQQLLDGEYATTKSELAAVQQELEAERASSQQQQIKSAAISAISQSGACNPEQAFSLLREYLRLKDGKLVVLSGGVENDINSHLNSLKQPGSGWEHNFNGSGARGMSASGSSSTSSGGKSWDSMNLSEQIAMKVADRENGTNHASKLQAQG